MSEVPAALRRSLRPKRRPSSPATTTKAGKVEVASDRIIIDGEPHDPNAFRPYPLDHLGMGKTAAVILRQKLQLGRFRLMLIRSFRVGEQTFRKIR